MNYFELPATTKVNQFIPKNAFDQYITSRQKKLFTDLVSRITWTHKLSPDTINLEGKEIREIQIFRIELKVKEDIAKILEIMDKSIPYHIIFVIEFDDSTYLSTSSKHPHPAKENKSVIDWTFSTEWFPSSEKRYKLLLKKSLDDIFHNFCIQLSGKSNMGDKPITELIGHLSEIETLKREIARLKIGIKNGKQFNHKVEMNLVLQDKLAELEMLMGSELP